MKASATFKSKNLSLRFFRVASGVTAFFTQAEACATTTQGTCEVGVGILRFAQDDKRKRAWTMAEQSPQA